MKQIEEIVPTSYLIYDLYEKRFYRGMSDETRIYETREAAMTRANALAANNPGQIFVLVETKFDIGVRFDKATELDDWDVRRAAEKAEEATRAPTDPQKDSSLS